MPKRDVSRIDMDYKERLYGATPKKMMGLILLIINLTLGIVE
jgi:hypothetical protein